jgi:hypothetical protein
MGSGLQLAVSILWRVRSDVATYWGQEVCAPWQELAMCNIAQCGYVQWAITRCCLRHRCPPLWTTVAVAARPNTCLPGMAFRYGEKLHYFAQSHLETKNGVRRTPCGLTFVSKWGSNRHAAGAAAILACYADGLVGINQPVAQAVMGFARSQVCS